MSSYYTEKAALAYNQQWRAFTARSLDATWNTIDSGHIRAYTLDEARTLCEGADVRVVADETFTVNRLLHGWALRAIAARW